MAEIIYAGWLLDGRGGQRQGQGILIEGDTIQAVGDLENLLKISPDAKVTANPDWVIAPGYLDAHDHGRAVTPLWFGARDCPLELWIPQLGKVAVPVYEAALYDGIQLAKSGVTTVVHCHNPMDISKMKEELLETARGYRSAGIRCVLCPPYTDQNSLIYTQREEFAASLGSEERAEFEQSVMDQPLSLEEYFALVEELREELSEEIKGGWADIQLHPVGGQWCSDQALKDITSYARKQGMRVHMHLLETKYQKIYSEKCWGESMVFHMDKLGVLGPWLTVAHGVWLDESDRKLLVEREVKVVTNPSSNLRLRSGIFQLQEALEAGVCCGIGLDGCTLDDDQDYGRELRLALYNPAKSGAAADITARQIMKMAYENNAKAVGGQLSPGKLVCGGQADFICFEGKMLDFPYACEEVSWEEKILQRGGKRTIAAVFCKGRKIAANGESVMADEKETARRLCDFAKERAKSSKKTKSSLLEAVRRFYLSWEEREEES